MVIKVIGVRCFIFLFKFPFGIQVIKCSFLECKIVEYIIFHLPLINKLKLKRPTKCDYL